MKQILKQKFLDMLESKSFGDMIVFIIKLVCWSLMSLALVYPYDMIYIVNSSIMWNNYLIIKVIFSFVLFFNLEHILNLYDFIRFWIKDNIKFIDTNTKNREMFYWVYIYDLIKYLIENKTCKVLDIEKEFQLPRNQTLALIKEIDNLSIFERWENNQRQLKEWYNFVNLYELMSKGLIKDNENHYSTKPNVVNS